MTDRLKVAGISGSLRSASYNTALLRAAFRLAGEDVDTDVVPIHAVPHYCDDLVPEPPAEVVELRRRVQEADALLVVTPEYNGGPPGVLKNALDWLSTPHRSSALRGKPVALAGASPGMLGTARAQGHLRSVLRLAGAEVVPGPEVLVARAHESFDSDLALLDPAAQELLDRLLANLVRAARVQSVRPSA